MKKKLEFKKSTVTKLDEKAMHDVKGGAADGFLSWWGCGCGKNSTDPLRQDSCRPATGTDTTCDGEHTSCDVIILKD